MLLLPLDLEGSVPDDTPPAVLEGRSAELLRRLLLLYAAVLLVLLPLAWYLAYVGSLRRVLSRSQRGSGALLTRFDGEGNSERWRERSVEWYSASSFRADAFQS